MTVPKISIVITTYNRAASLPAALDSVLAQTRKDLEVVVWDDGSTDHTLEVIQAYADRDPRVRLFAKPHQGRVEALRQAMDQAQGEYMGWVDSDDWLALTALEETAGYLDAHPDVRWIYTDYVNVGEQGEVLSYGRRCRIPYNATRLLVEFMTFHFRLFRRSLYEQVGGFDYHINQVEDYDLCLRFSEVSDPIHLHRPLYYYRQRADYPADHHWNQVVWSREIINRALIRRGMRDRFCVDVVGDRFILRQRSQPRQNHRLAAGGDRLMVWQAAALAALPIVGLTGTPVLAASDPVPVSPETAQISPQQADTYRSTDLLSPPAQPPTPEAIAPPTLAPLSAAPSPALVSPPEEPSSSATGDRWLVAEVTPADDGTQTEVNHRLGTTGDRYTIDGGQRSRDGANLFHSFDEFGLDAGDLANFRSPSDVQNILGRVTGGDASLIDGTLRVSGSDANLFLMNPAGIIFGENARLDLSGNFTATTATGIQLEDDWFTAVGSNDYANLVGNPSAFAFTAPTGEATGVIVNAGNLSLEPERSLTLVGGIVVNTGVLDTPGGTVTLAAVPGEQVVRLSQTGQLLSLDFNRLDRATRQAIPALPFTPMSLPNLLTDPSIRNATDISVTANGSIQLSGSGLQWSPQSGMVIASGEISVDDRRRGETGGEVAIVGDRVALTDADIDATGDSGGGTIRIGGAYQGQDSLPGSDRTFVDQASTLRADAIRQGNGGTIIVWADGSTWFQGEATVRGGDRSGDGGFVEISGLEYLDYQGRVDATAANGDRGTLLLDPTNIVVNNTSPNFTLATVDAFNDPDTNTGTNTTELNAGALEFAFADIILQATNNITFDAAVNIGPGYGGSELRAEAGNQIRVNESITVSGINVILDAGNRILLNAPISTNGGRIDLSAPQQIIEGNLNAGGGAIALTTQDLDVRSGFFASNGSRLTIAPEQADQPLRITSNQANIFQDGFDSITIGHPNGSGLLTIASALSFRDPATLRSPNGSIVINGELGGLGDGSITIEGAGSTTTLNASIITASTPITIDDSVILGESVLLSTTSDNTPGADITITGTINDSSPDTAILSLQSGGGDIFLEGTVGNTAPLAALGATGNSITFAENVSTQGIIAVSGLRLQLGGTLFSAGNSTTFSNGITINTDELEVLDSVDALEIHAGPNLLSLRADNIRFGAADVTLTGDEIDLRGLEASTTFVEGSGNLVLQPSTPGLAIQVASSSPTDDRLDLTPDELGSLGSGLASLTIGRADGSGTVTIEQDLTVFPPLTVRSPSGAGNILAQGDLTGSSSITLLANQQIRTRNITAPNGITLTSLSGGVNTQGSVLDTSTEGDNAGDVTIEAATIARLGSITTEADEGSGGDIRVSGRRIDASQGLLSSSADQDGGDITLEAIGDIVTGAITTASNDGTGGDITLISQRGSINTTLGTPIPASELLQLDGELLSISGATSLLGLLSASARGTGGNIELRAARDIQTSNLISTSLLGDRAGTITLRSTNGNINTSAAQTFTAEGSTVSYEFFGIDAGAIAGAGGAILLESNGTIVASDIQSAGGVQGGPITLLAPTQITTGAINSSSLEGSGGNVTIDPEGDVQVRYINSQGGTVGGNIDITTGRFFRATDTFIDRNGLVASLSSAGGQQGGSIIIRHAGFANDVPFTVAADFTGQNGTAGVITTGTDNTIAAGIFPETYNQGTAPNDIQLITGSRDVPPEIPGESDAPDDPSIPPIRFNPPPLVGEPSTPVVTLDEARDSLRSIEEATGVRPALIYVQFVPSVLPGAIAGLDVPVYQGGATARRETPDPGFEQRETVLTQTVEAYYGLPGGDRGSPLAVDDPQEEVELLLVTAEGNPVLYRPGIERSQFLEIARTFQQEVSDPRRTRSTSYQASARQLYNWLIQPMLADLSDREVQNLVFIGTTGVRALPYAALQNPSTGRFLVEDYSVGTMPSLSLTDSRYVDVRDSSILAMGASTFPDQLPLPAVPLELQSIFVDEETGDNLWQGEEFLNEQFTLSNLRSQRQQTPFGIVHLATHGEFRQGDPSNSYIQLEDTRLQMDQLRQLNWNNPQVELLVLSACRTALGDDGAELGFAGLAAQLGVRSAMGSLWYVSDVGTLALVDEFYERLQTEPIKAQALQQAQVSMIQGLVELPTEVSSSSAAPPSTALLRHPYYWSGFTLVGNPW